MPDLPTGTVTFLFTDIEGSTRLWERRPDAMRAALARHHALIATEIQERDGIVVKSQGEGDSVFAVFARASDAIAAACDLQRSLTVEPWPPETCLRVRVALHTGEADLRDGDYFGAAVNRCARLRAAGHGSQVLLSEVTQGLVRDDLPSGASLRDLGLHRLRDLQRPEHVFQLAHPNLPAGFPPLVSLDALPNNLPLQVTSFVGREKEMAEVNRLLGATRLLTLTGMGGTGKTRLALQVAADLLPEYPDGVWLVELAPLANPILVSPTVASALGVREEPGRLMAQTLVDTLKPKRLLVVLDNCEHLLAACAQVADTLVRGCPSVQILATSREGLNIMGEQTYRVPSLALPEGRELSPLERLQGFEAVRLFADRARLAQPSFAVTSANAAAVAKVCQRLDGIPLALELAAARVKALPVEKIHERLDDRFRLLTGGSRTALPRQQTLRATVDWSYELLAEGERTLLRRLSVFAGGFTLEAAESVCGGETIGSYEVLDLLGQLVDKSLVLVVEQAGEARYRLLETIREFGEEKLQGLAEAEVLHQRHCDCFLALAEQAAPNLYGLEQAVWLDRLEREHDNLRAAQVWGFGNDSASALRLAGALGQFWGMRGYFAEGREHLARLLALPEAQARTAARAQALYLAGRLAREQADFGAARALLGDSLAISRELGDEGIIASALRALAQIAHDQGDYGEARSLREEGLAIYRQLGDKRGIAWSLSGLGYVAHAQGDYTAARALLEESLAIQRELGDKYGIAWSLGALGEVAHAQEAYEEAWALLKDSLAIQRELGRKQGIAWSLCDLGVVARDQGDYETARALLEESLAIYRELGFKQGLGESLNGLATLAVAQAQSERAARLLGAAESLRGAIGAPLPPAGRAEHDRCVAAVHTALGEEAFAAAWADGRAMTLDEAVCYALEAGAPQGAGTRSTG